MYLITRLRHSFYSFHLSDLARTLFLVNKNYQNFSYKTLRTLSLVFSTNSTISVQIYRFSTFSRHSIFDGFRYQQVRYLSRKNSRLKFSKSQVEDLSALKESSSEDFSKKHRDKKSELPKAYLRDENDRLLGLMTMVEAQQLAKKHKKLLIEVDSPTKKIPTVKFSDPRSESKATESVAEDYPDIDAGDSKLQDSQNKKMTPKVVSFTSKVSKHDLQVKINQVKKFLQRGQETLVRVSSLTIDSGHIQKLESIFREFEQIFNETSGVRINQKRLANRYLKFNILIIDMEKVRQKLSSDHQTLDGENNRMLNLDQINPNKLLEIKDFEKILDEIKDLKTDKSSK